MKICPECITELKKQFKRLGRRTRKWNICPKCGYREPENTFYHDKLDEENTKQALENMNCKNYE